MAFVTAESNDPHVWNRVRAGDVVLVKKVGEISHLITAFSGSVNRGDSKRGRGSMLSQIHKKPSIYIYARLKLISDLIEARIVNFAIAPVLAKLGFPLDGMIEPGRLRFFFPPGYPKLASAESREEAR